MKTIEQYSKQLGTIGYYVAYFGVFLILLWIGVFKFTPTEAEAIRPLVENHPLTSWMYSVFSEQSVSNVFGTVEVLTALVLLVGLKFEVARRIAALLVIAIFATTISFLCTTPGVWETVDGVLITQFFIVKDLVMLGFGGIIMAGVSKK